MTAVLGVTFLGNTYATANAVPNLLFEIVAGGALAAVVLPALAPAVARQDRESSARAASALVNVGLVALTPVVLAGLLFRGPLMGVLTSGVEDQGLRALERDLGSFLLLLFLPQVWLYAIGIVLTGTLQAHRRFAWPALAPLLSSVVVTASYVLYAMVEGGNAGHLERISPAGRLILGLGTTAGVAALSLSLVIPAHRLGLRWRPILHIPAEARTTIRRLAGSAVIAVGAQQVLLAVVVVIANSVRGGVVAYQLGFTMLLAFWAVFPVPMATAAFPDLASAASKGDRAQFAHHSSQAAKRVVVLVFGGAAILVAAAPPLARLILALGAGKGVASPSMLAMAIGLFAPGLVGYGAYALLTRAAYALGDGRSPARGAVLGFGSAVLLDVVAAQFLGGPALIGALAGSFSIGVTAGALVLLGMFRARAGREAVEGIRITAARGLVSGIAGAAVGSLAARALPGAEPATVAASLVATGVAAALAAGVYVLGQRLLGDRVLIEALAGLRSAR